MYKSFDKDNLPYMKKAILAALEPLGKAFGMTFKLDDRMSYTNNSFEVKITCAIGDGEQVEIDQFNLYCTRYGIPKDAYKKLFESGGKLLRLVGFSTKSRKYVCLCEIMEPDGQTVSERMRYTLPSVKKGLGIS